MDTKRIVPALLAILSGAGVIATAVLAVKATPKALDRMEDKAASNTKSTDSFWETTTRAEHIALLSTEEKIRAAWKCYIPAGSVALATIGCIVGGAILNKGAQASIAGAYALVNESYKRFRTGAEDVFGPGAVSKITGHMAREAIPEEEAKQLEISDDDFLCYEWLTGNYFSLPRSDVFRAQHQLNKMYMESDVVSLNDYMNFLGVGDVEGGDDIVWMREKRERGLKFENIYTELEPDFVCLVVTPMYEP